MRRSKSHWWWWDPGSVELVRRGKRHAGMGCSCETVQESFHSLQRDGHRITSTLHPIPSRVRGDLAAVWYWWEAVSDPLHQYVSQYVSFEHDWPKQWSRPIYLQVTTPWAKSGPSTQTVSIKLWRDIHLFRERWSTSRKVLGMCLGRGQVNYSCLDIWPAHGRQIYQY